MERRTDKEMETEREKGISVKRIKKWIDGGREEQRDGAKMERK